MSRTLSAPRRAKGAWERAASLDEVDPEWLFDSSAACDLEDPPTEPGVVNHASWAGCNIVSTSRSFARFSILQGRELCTLVYTMCNRSYSTCRVTKSAASINS